MDDIKHDPDPLLTRMMNLMWRYDKDPSADALVNVLNEAAAEIERLRAVADQLAEALEVQCAFHRIPVITRPYYTQHAKDALAAWKEDRRG